MSEAFRKYSKAPRQSQDGHRTERNDTGLRELLSVSKLGESDVPSIYKATDSGLHPWSLEAGAKRCYPQHSDSRESASMPSLGYEDVQQCPLLGRRYSVS